VTAAHALALLSAAWVAFAYAGYPAALALLARLSPQRPIRRTPHQPPLSIVIAVHNGASILRAKLEATLALDYAGEREVIVASDASTDGTDAIAAGFAERGVRLVRSETRGGKEAAQARAVALAKGAILVFTDLGAEVERDALVRIVEPFADPAVGSVSSEDVVSTVEGEGAYVRYEMALRRLESRATTLVGLSGSCFAVRRALCDAWRPDLDSDFRLALETAAHGLRAVSAPSARARIGALSDARREWERKVRTVRRGLAVLSAYRGLLSPRHGRVALSLWGHKVARFTSPFALLGLLAASAWAAREPIGGALLAAQVLGYGLGAAALVVPAVGRAALPRLLGFFLLVNASMLVAWWHHLAGRRVLVWEPTRR
jgi:cellulose synthase/poly-beta-1,6-N-acetylglucosamine synthase-like glycosyltransferase